MCDLGEEGRWGRGLGRGSSGRCRGQVRGRGVRDGDVERVRFALHYQQLRQRSLISRRRRRSRWRPRCPGYPHSRCSRTSGSSVPLLDHSR